MNKSLYNVNSIYPYIRSYNTKYWEQLQKFMDASKTRAQNVELRRRWIEKQNKMNYQNEYDRLNGELSKLPTDLQKYAIQNLMDKQKLEVIGQYNESVKNTLPVSANISHTPQRTSQRTPQRTPSQSYASSSLSSTPSRSLAPTPVPTPSDTPRNIRRPRRTREQIQQDIKEEEQLRSIRRDLKKEKKRGKVLRKILANQTGSQSSNQV
jgi:hypothetical protein